MKFATLAALSIEQAATMKIVGDYTEGYICDNLLPLYTVPSVGGEYDLLSS